MATQLLEKLYTHRANFIIILTRTNLGGENMGNPFFMQRIHKSSNHEQSHSPLTLTLFRCFVVSLDLSMRGDCLYYSFPGSSISEISVIIMNIYRHGEATVYRLLIAETPSRFNHSSSEIIYYHDSCFLKTC